MINIFIPSYHRPDNIKTCKYFERLGYDMSKIYNVGGMAQYAGEQYRDYITDTEELNIEVKYLINAN